MDNAKKTAAALLWLVLASVPAWTKPNLNTLGNQCGSQRKQSACNELVKIALGDKDLTIRRQAVSNLYDQSLLAKVVTETTDPAVRTAAVGQLTDQSILAQLATSASDAGVRRVVAARLTDPSLIAKTATTDTDANVRRASVEKVTDEQLLAKIAAADSDASVRRAAQAKLNAAAAKSEQKDWDSALEPFDIASLQAFLQKYPSGQHSRTARQIVEDEALIEQIATSGPGSRFVISSDSLPPFIANSVGVNDDRGRTVIDAANHSAMSVFGKAILGQINATNITNPNQVSVTMNPLMPCGDRSVFVVSGTAFNIQGDSADPIRLLYSKQYGLVVLGGRGKISSLRNGTVGAVIFQTP